MKTSRYREEQVADALRLAVHGEWGPYGSLCGLFNRRGVAMKRYGLVLVIGFSACAPAPQGPPPQAEAVQAPPAAAVASNQNASSRERVEAGATCAELFAYRNSLDPKSPLIDTINVGLRDIQCYSSTSTRVDPPSPGVSAAPRPADAPSTRFTMREYRMYRSIIDAPMSVSEADSVRRAAKEYGASEEDVKNAVGKVQDVLTANRWFGRPEVEIRHASDWNE